MRKWAVSPALKDFEKYILYLEKIEEGFYDENDNLMEEKLLRHQSLKEKRVEL